MKKIPVSWLKVKAVLTLSIFLRFCRNNEFFSSATAVAKDGSTTTIGCSDVISRANALTQLCLKFVCFLTKSTSCEENYTHEQIYLEIYASSGNIVLPALRPTHIELHISHAHIMQARKNMKII